MPKFYDQENDEDGSYEPQHSAYNKATGTLKNDLGHGTTCDHCNDAKLEGIQNNMDRSTVFHLSRLSHQLDDGKKFGKN
jgi:hypothetical protein